MINLVTDTHQLITHLESFGFTKKQAEGVTEALTKLEVSQLATKQDLIDFKNELKQEIQSVRLEVTELKADIFKWIVPLMLGQTALFGAIVKFIH